MPKTLDDLQNILECHVIPWWENYGLERLAVSAATLRGFQKQALSPLMRVSVKKRRSRQVLTRGPRHHNNACTSNAVWPQDAQETCRHPILVCVLKGCADFHIADYIVHCPEGHFLLMRPGVPQPDGSRAHLEIGSGAEYCEVFHMSLQPGAACISSWVCYSQPDRHWTQHECAIHQTDMLHQFSFFMREMLEVPAGYQKTAHNSLLNFLLLFQRELKAGRLLTKPRNAAAVDDSAMLLAQEYMRSHLHHHLTTTEVAEAVFMSRTTFLRYFSRATGQSFNQYLTELRLEKAQYLLAGSRISVRATSEEVGLKTAQLYRLFKQHLDVSPSEFQQKQKMVQND